ncbi:MAG: HAD family phosphatase [Arachnia sp.]
MPDAIVFDLDGTLVETEHVWDTVRRGLATDAGRAWPTDATQAMMGMSTAEWSTYLVEVVGLPGTPEEVARRTVDAMAAHYREGVAVADGAVAAVRRMAERYPVAIASSSPRQLIDAAVEVLGLTDVLTATVSTEEVERGKPAPDGYLRACALLGVDPARCVAVEDSPNGLLSARNAGMSVVVIPPPFNAPTAEQLAGAHVVASLDQLTVDYVEGISPSAS